ncbi:MAG: prepilin-type N-terminal cleavage/methylation domain-containing protein [Verrucomicrobiota bacterium]
MELREKSANTRNAEGAGFTLLELVAVVAVISILAAFTYPAMRALTSAPARATGLREVVSAMDQARMAAISRGEAVALVFVDETIDDDERPFRSYAVYRVRSYDSGVTGASGSGRWKAVEALSSWERLSSGAFFGTVGNGGFDRETIFDAPSEEGVGEILFQGEGAYMFPAIVFNKFGGVVSPRPGIPLVVSVSEGVVRGGRATVTGPGTDRGAVAEVVEVARQTGRPRVVSNSAAWDEQ